DAAFEARALLFERPVAPVAVGPAAAVIDVHHHEPLALTAGVNDHRLADGCGCDRLLEIEPALDEKVDPVDVGSELATGPAVAAHEGDDDVRSGFLQGTHVSFCRGRERRLRPYAAAAFEVGETDEAHRELSEADDAVP